MTLDKKLRMVTLSGVLEKRRIGQALNAKQFAVVAGISYSAAREWFRLPGFPVFRGVVFWQDFESWRAAQTGLSKRDAGKDTDYTRHREHRITGTESPPQAARIVAELVEGLSWFDSLSVKTVLEIFSRICRFTALLVHTRLSP